MVDIKAEPEAYIIGIPTNNVSTGVSTTPPPKPANEPNMPAHRPAIIISMNLARAIMFPSIDAAHLLSLLRVISQYKMNILT